MKRIGGVVIQERMGLRRLQLMRSGNRQSRRGQPRTKCNGCVEPHAESVTIAKLIGRCCSDRTVRSDDAGNRAGCLGGLGHIRQQATTRS